MWMGMIRRQQTPRPSGREPREFPVTADLDALYPGVEALLENIDYLITSRDVPGNLTGMNDLRRSLPEARKRFGCRLSRGNAGEEGVLVWDGDKFHYARAFMVEPVDTTGAGDIFHAGLSMVCCRAGRCESNWSLLVRRQR